jgi:glycosyltransferase involved in cell wall biosynthesis
MARCHLATEWEGSDEWRMAKKLSDGIVAAQQAGGVTFLGRVSRDVMLDTVRHAACMAYPFEVYAACETWSTSILEAHAIGAPVVLAPVDALASLWSDSALLTATHNTPEFRESFVSTVVRVLTDSKLAAECSEMGKAKAKPLTFDAAGAALDGIIRKHWSHS